MMENCLSWAEPGWRLGCARPGQAGLCKLFCHISDLDWQDGAGV